MYRYKYMKPPFDTTPQEIMDKYNLTDIAQNGKVYSNNLKVRYGL